MSFSNAPKANEPVLRIRQAMLGRLYAAVAAAFLILYFSLPDRWEGVARMILWFKILGKVVLYGGW